MKVEQLKVEVIENMMKAISSENVPMLEQLTKIFRSLVYYEVELLKTELDRPSES